MFWNRLQMIDVLNVCIKQCLPVALFSFGTRAICHSHPHLMLLLGPS